MMIAFLFACLTFGSSEHVDHKYYVSLAEIIYNTDSQKLEVALKIDYEDLQQAVMVEQNLLISDPLTNHTNEIQAYLNNHFQILDANDNAINFSYVSMKDELEAVWIYLESEPHTFTDTWTVKNTIFVDLFSAQTNWVNFYPDKLNLSRVEGLILNSQKREGRIDFNS